MGCVVSRLEDEEEEVVTICKERKKLLKEAVKRRRAFSEAHAKYFQSLYAVAAAIKLFVARHSSPTSPFMITFPPPLETDEKCITKSLKEGEVACSDCVSCISTPTSSDSGEQRDGKHVEDLNTESYSYMYTQMPPFTHSPVRDFGWDYFNPFEVIGPELMNAYAKTSDDEIRAVREQEGIPELEEEGAEENEKLECVADEPKNNINGEMQSNLNGFDSSGQGRELLEALTDIMDHFVNACDFGKEVSRMLETKTVYLQSEIEESKDKSKKFIHALPWHTSKPSSCKSLVVSHSKRMVTWNECSNDLFDDYGGMEAGSHSQTLGRLYAWEKKLYEEVKAGDEMRKDFEKKSSRLRNQDARGENELTLDKARASLKDLYARIIVAVRSAESISMKIEKLRDDELHPQIMELLRGLTRTWEAVLHSHEMQKKIVNEVTTFACPSIGKFCNESYRLATLQLEAELQNWRECFTGYVASQNAYVEALHGWLAKFLVPGQLAPFVNGPPSLLVLKKWLSTTERVPHKAVSYAMKGCAKDLRCLWSQQGDELQLKRRVENLSKELERKTRTDIRSFDVECMERNANADDRLPTPTTEQSEILKRKLQILSDKHQDSIQQTRSITVSALRNGFSSVFECLTEFSKAYLIMYGDLASPREEKDDRCFLDV